MGIVIFGAGVIMLTLQVKMQKKIKDYIKNQIQEDYVSDQISMKEFIDPFTGEQVKQSKK